MLIPFLQTFTPPENKDSNHAYWLKSSFTNLNSIAYIAPLADIHTTGEEYSNYWLKSEYNKCIYLNPNAYIAPLTDIHTT